MAAKPTHQIDEDRHQSANIVDERIRREEEAVGDDLHAQLECHRRHEEVIGNLKYLTSE